MALIYTIQESGNIKYGANVEQIKELEEIYESWTGRKSLHRGYPSKEINQIGLVVDKAIVNANKQKKRRDYLGGSSLGEECAKEKIQYRFMGVDIDEERDFSAQTLRIFSI